MTDQRASATMEIMRGETVYEWVLHIEKIAHAAEIVADNMPELADRGAPPIHYLLEMLVFELRALAGKVSD